MFLPMCWIPKWFCLILLMGMSGLALANPTEQNLQQAQTAFQAQQNGQLEKAIQNYGQVLQQGYFSPALYNNLGLAYAQKGQLGKAIVQWERALKLEAQYTEAQHNLAAAQQYIHHPISATPSIALVQVWQNIHQSLSAQTWGFLFLLLWSSSLALGAFAWKKGGNAWKSQQEIKLALGIFVVSWLPLTLGMSQQAQEQEKGIAIVVAEQAGLRPFPELSSEEMEILSEGIRLKILEQDREWVKVELPNYLVGWVPKSLIEQV